MTRSSASGPGMTGRSWLPLVLAWSAAGVGLALWLVTTQVPELREQLKTLQFWWLEATVVAGVALGAAVARDLWRRLERRDVAAMATVATLALALTLFVAPRTSRIYYDEQIYQGIGQNMADARRAQMCNDATLEYGRLQCWSAEYNKQPYAYSHLLSLVYRAFGVHESAAFLVNAVVMAASVVAMFLLALLFFEDRAAAFFSALAFALIPEQLVWSATAAVEPSASLACALALVAVVSFVRTRTDATLAAAVVAAAYAAQFRPESLLVFAPAALVVWQEARDECRRPRLWWAALAGLALLAVHIAHLYAVRNEGWGTSDARLSLRYVADNLRVNGRFYFADERFPVVLTILAVVGLAAPRRPMSRLPLVVYFLVFFGIDLVFYAGSFNYGADVRYSLMTFPPLAVLAGLGAAHVADGASRVAKSAWMHRAVAAALLFQFLWYAPLVRATTEEAWAARADVAFARAVARDLPPNSYVLTHNPAMFHVWGVNAGQVSTVVANPSYLTYLGSRYAGGVYFHWNFWCNVTDPAQQELCRAIMGFAPSDPFREHLERDQRFGFHRFRVPTGTAPLGVVPGTAASGPGEAR
jgi:hypothetical protein